MIPEDLIEKTNKIINFKKDEQRLFERNILIVFLIIIVSIPFYFIFGFVTYEICGLNFNNETFIINGTMTLFCNKHHDLYFHIMGGTLLWLTWLAIPILLLVLICMNTYFVIKRIEKYFKTRNIIRENTNIGDPATAKIVYELLDEYN